MFTTDVNSAAKMKSFAVVCIVVGLISAAVGAEVFKCYSVASNNYCLYTDGSLLSRNKAREFCAARNSTLPIISDEQIDNVFQQFIVTHAHNQILNRPVWIDAQARQISGSYSWHWIDGQPSALNSSDFRHHSDKNWCATVGTFSGKPALFENYWTNKQHYICQYDYNNGRVSSTSTSDSCLARWIVYPDTNVDSYNVILQSTKTQQECLGACVADSSCVAVDWNYYWSPGFGCWIHRSHGQRRLHTHVTRFEIIRHCNTSSDGRCDDAFQVNSTCYKVHKNERVSWFTAVNKCLSNNARLAVFNDEVREYFPTSLLSLQAWIGLLKSWWTWPDGRDVLYNKFNVSGSSPPYNPSRHPNSDYNCVVDTTDGQWRVARCTERHVVVCQSDYLLPGNSAMAKTTANPTELSPMTSVAAETACPCDVSKDNSAAVAALAVLLSISLVVNIALVIYVFVSKSNETTKAETTTDYVQSAAESPSCGAMNVRDTSSPAIVYEQLNTTVYETTNIGAASNPPVVYDQLDIATSETGYHSAV